MSEYGLPGVRDKDGELQSVEHTFRFDGDEIDIKLRPPTITEYEDLEELMDEDDVEPDELEAVARDYLVKPDIPEDESLSFRETVAYIHGIMDHAAGGSGVHEEIQEELEELQQEQAGN